MTELWKKGMTPTEPSKWDSAAETRLVNRRCRCGKLAFERNPGCAWHAATSADYANDLACALIAATSEPRWKRFVRVLFGRPARAEREAKQ